MFQLIRILSYLMFAWFVVSTMARLHWSVLLITTAVAVVNTGVIYLLRVKPAALTRYRRSKLVRRYIDWIGYLAGEELSLNANEATRRRVRLTSVHDFEAACQQAKRFVRGHNDVLDSVLSRLYESVALRKSHRKTEKSGPLCSFLFVGRNGIGKRHLSRVVSKLLYGSAEIEVFDCVRLGSEFLLGLPASPGKLFEIADKSTCTLIYFENIQNAEAGVVHALLDLLKTGSLVPPGQNKRVSFHDTTIVLSACLPTGESGSFGSISGGSRNPDEAIGVVAADLGIDPRLAEAATEVCFLATPSDQVKAEVFAMHLQSACREHGVELSHVAPEIVATQVMQITDEVGFELLLPRVKKLVRRPLVAAATQRAATLSLRVRS